MKEPSGCGGGGGSACCPCPDPGAEDDDVAEGEECEEGRTFGPGWEGFDFVRTRAQENKPPLCLGLVLEEDLVVWVVVDEVGVGGSRGRWEVVVVVRCVCDADVYA